jgi:hypothetical protein
MVSLHYRLARTNNNNKSVTLDLHTSRVYQLRICLTNYSLRRVTCGLEEITKDVQRLLEMPQEVPGTGQYQVEVRPPL